MSTISEASRSRGGLFRWLPIILPLLGLPTAFTFGDECWQWKRVAAEPPQRALHQIVSDTRRGVLVMFGGTDIDGTLGDTWEFDGKWRLRSTTGPTRRQGSAMAFDEARGVTVLFGGQFDNAVYSDETWIWDGLEWTLLQVEGPSARSYHAMIYDRESGEVLLFGGSGSREIWAWDGESWTLRSDDSPTALGRPMSHDTKRGVFVFYRGETIWELRGTEWWQRSVDGPEPRVGAAMAFDPARGVSVLFGGFEYERDLIFGDLWEWDGESWTHRSTSTGPDRRIAPALMYDPIRESILLHGGYQRWRWEAEFRDDFWGWDGTEWTSYGGPIRVSSIAYDSERRRTAVFADIGGDSRRLETWEWNGISWSHPATRGPDGRRGSVMAHDPLRGQTVSVEGLRGDTWGWDGMAWELLGSTTPRWGRAMVYDSRREVSVLFGGRTSNQRYGDTREWDGTGWHLISGDGPSPRDQHAMAYDSARGVTVLFGGDDEGRDPLGDTWERDGTEWALVATGGPVARRGHSMTYDSFAGLTIMHGGTSRNIKTWAWDGDTWRILVDQPPRLYSGVMSYDSARRVTVSVTGPGWSFGGGPRETWELAPAVVRGDLNGDCAIDMADFVVYEACMAGPDISSPPPTCAPEKFDLADFDQDGDVDLADFPTLQRNFEGL